jgi:hypothetical protein
MGRQNPNQVLKLILDFLQFQKKTGGTERNNEWNLEESYFTLEEYRIKRDEVCRNKNFMTKEISGGFISLLHKGIIKYE